MKIKERNLVIVYVVIAAILVIGCFGVKYYFDHGLDAQIEESIIEEEKEKVTVPRETVAINVAKFNTEVMDQTAWVLNPANDETLIIFEGNYWYPLTEEVSLVIVPETMSENREADVVKVALIHIGSDAGEEAQAQARQYWQLLVEANHEDLDTEQAMQLMNEAETAAKNDQMIMDEEGLFVAVKRMEDHTEYQVVRIETVETEAEVLPAGE